MAEPLTPTEKIAFLKRKLRQEGRAGSMSFLARRKEFSLIACDSLLSAAASRYGFTQTDIGTQTTTSTLIAAKLANLADENALAELERQKINLSVAIKNAESSAKRRLTQAANRAAEAHKENFETFDGWLQFGRSVRKGEKASKTIGNHKLFHYSQTYDSKALFEDMNAMGLHTANAWASRGRKLRNGAIPSVTHEQIDFYSEDATQFIVRNMRQ